MRQPAVSFTWNHRENCLDGQRIRVLLFTVILYSISFQCCTGQQKVHPPKYTTATAHCISPKGAYTTVVHTAPDGYLYFKQSFSYSKDCFEAVVTDKIRGYQLSDSNKLLSAQTIYAIRNHDFQGMALEIDRRFKDFGRPVYSKANDTMGVYRLTASDELHQPCTLYFDAESKLLKELHIMNPGQNNDTIKTRFAHWALIDHLLLPVEIAIEQGGKTFVLKFGSVLINSPEFKYISLSE